MNYNLLMEGWRKFLKEEEDDQLPSTIDKDAVGEPEDEFVGPPNVDETFPIVDGQNFVLPMAGIAGGVGEAGFFQPRGGGIHGGWDQFVDVGKEVRAISSGIIKPVNKGERMDLESQNLIFIINRHYQPKDPTGIVWDSKYPKPNGILISTWNGLREWNQKQTAVGKLPKDYLAKLIRDPKRKGRFKYLMSQNGKGAVLVTDPDQHGTSFKIVYSHLSKVSVPSGKSRVKVGDVIGLSGHTAIFDSKPHLHFELIDMGYSKRKQKLIGSIGKNGRKVGQTNPIYVIPGCQGAEEGSGAYSKFK